MLGNVIAAVLVVGMLLAPLAAFAWAAVMFGADSRPGLAERDPRPWL